MGALATAVQSGKALYVGLSNYDGPTLEKATAILDELHVPFIINQNRYNIFDRTVERNGLKETAKQSWQGTHHVLAARTGPAHEPLSQRRARRQPHRT